MNSLVTSEWIVNATRRYIAERAETYPEIAAFVETLDALPLYADWGGGVALRSDGEHERQSFELRQYHFTESGVGCRQRSVEFDSEQSNREYNISVSIAQAEDLQQTIFPLTVEYVGTIQG